VIKRVWTDWETETVTERQTGRLTEIFVPVCVDVAVHGQTGADDVTTVTAAAEG